MSPVIIKGLITGGGIGLGGIGIWQLNEYMAPRTLKEVIEREGETFYSLTSDADGDLTNWKNLASKYKTDSTNTNKFSDLTIGDSPSNEDGKNLRNKCKALADKVPGGQDQEGDLSKLRSWCVVIKTVTPASPTAG